MQNIKTPHKLRIQCRFSHLFIFKITLTVANLVYVWYTAGKPVTQPPLTQIKRDGGFPSCLSCQMWRLPCFLWARRVVSLLLMSYKAHLLIKRKMVCNSIRQRFRGLHIFHRKSSSNKYTSRNKSSGEGIKTYHHLEIDL